MPSPALARVVLARRGVIPAIAFSCSVALLASVARAPVERVPLRHPTPAVVRLARSYLGLPMGAERYVEVDGRRCVFVVEPHYHPQGYTQGPQGWHKGVTVYELR